MVQTVLCRVGTQPAQLSLIQPLRTELADFSFRTFVIETFTCLRYSAWINREVTMGWSQRFRNGQIKGRFFTCSRNEHAATQTRAWRVFLLLSESHVQLHFNRITHAADMEPQLSRLETLGTCRNSLFILSAGWYSAWRLYLLLITNILQHLVLFLDI